MFVANFVATWKIKILRNVYAVNYGAQHYVNLTTW